MIDVTLINLRANSSEARVASFTNDEVGRDEARSLTDQLNQMLAEKGVHHCIVRMLTPCVADRDPYGCDCDDCGAEAEAQHKDEMAAENAWLVAAEYDPRMDDPREW